MVGEVMLSQFRDLGVRLIAADSGVDLTTGHDDPTRTLIRQALGAVSQFEKSVIVLKLPAARDRVRQSTGRCEGRKPFGTRPGEAETLARMRQLRPKKPGCMRLSFAKIATVLRGRVSYTRGKALASQVGCEDPEQVRKKYLQIYCSYKCKEFYS